MEVKDINAERLSRWANSTTRQKTTTTTPQTVQPQGSSFIDKLKGFGQGLVRPVAELGVSAFNAGAGTASLIDALKSGRNYTINQNVSRNVPGFGEVKPAFTGSETAGELAKKQVGYGAELASWLPFGKGVSTVAKSGVKGLVGQGAKAGLLEGSASGALFGGGRALQQGESVGTAGVEALKSGVIGGAAGGTIGAITPLFGLGVRGVVRKVREAINPDLKAQRLVGDAVDLYRKTLRPTQGFVKNYEIRKGRNLDDAFEFMADEGVIINKDSANRLVTTDAIAQLQSKMDEPYTNLQTILGSDTKKRINLYDVWQRARKEVSDVSGLSALEKVSMKKDIDDIMMAEFDRLGALDKAGEVVAKRTNVDGSTANAIKQGLWKMGYLPDRPSANTMSRKLGYIIKEKITDAYKGKKINGQDITELNELLAKYADASQILEKAHGKVAPLGAMGKNFARVVGGLAGMNVPVIGPIIGQEVGARVATGLASPARLTGQAVKKASEARGIRVKLSEGISNLKNNQQGFAKIPFIKTEFNKMGKLESGLESAYSTQRDAAIAGLNSLKHQDFNSLGAKKLPDIELSAEVDRLKEIRVKKIK